MAESGLPKISRPAERAPVVWTQGRAPRSTGLPTVNDLNLRRRTFIGENILDSKNLKELALLDGPAGVIRYLPSSIAAVLGAFIGFLRG